MDAGLKSTGLEMVQWHGADWSGVRNLQKGKGSQGIHKGHTGWKAWREEKPQGRSRPQKGIAETQRQRASGAGEGKLARGCRSPRHSALLQSPGNDSRVEAPRDRDKALPSSLGQCPRSGRLLVFEASRENCKSLLKDTEEAPVTKKNIHVS